jgi:hypothetical protein
MLMLVAVGAAIAGFAFSTAAKRGDDEVAEQSRSAAAGPQKVVLGWEESVGSGREKLVFSVESLEILEHGWRAEIALENRMNMSYEVAATHDRPFGLMLLSSGDHEALEEQNEAGTLPLIRPASRFEPPLPTILEPGDSWSGTMSAPGALVANSWVRVVFGLLVSVVDRDEQLSWITDHTHPLQP